MSKTKHRFKPDIKITAVFLIIAMLFAFIVSNASLSSNVEAATSLTSIGLAEHGVNAYKDGWVYVWGNQGETIEDTRSSDCSGLIYAYYTDNGSSYYRTTTEIMSNAVQSGDISTLPRIHGLVLGQPGHIGIYIGNDISIDNSDTQNNMRQRTVSNYSWTGWYMLGKLNYPTNGWYSFNGNMYHYTDSQYDINTTIEYNGVTYTIGSDGIVCDSLGNPIAVDNTMPNDGYTDAKNITIEDNIPVKTSSSAETIGTISGSSVNLRSEPNTSSSIVTSLSKGTTVYVRNTVQGASITSNGQASTKWYYINTEGGTSGYISSLYVKLSEGASASVTDPSISHADGYVEITSSIENATIYYTTDGSSPSDSSTIYVGSIYHNSGTTYNAIAVYGDYTSSVSTASIMTNGEIYSDLMCSDWYFENVDKVISNGIMSGYGNSTFLPGNDITRAEFVSALANLANADLTQYKNQTSKFIDVDKDSWYNSAIIWASNNGYISGFDDTFKPNDSITREQMCVIIAKFSNLSSSNSSNTFADDSSISSWAKDAVYACKNNGVISGVGNNNFSPKSTSTRAQVATVLVNI